ncbi:MAG: shikimate kinase [Candidatus Limimorpha sp.]
MVTRIFILGYMGAGKTTIARRLAQRLGWRFFDTDKMVEESTGLSIDEYFKKNGEGAFRQLETKVLQCTAELDHVVVSTGGGTPCFNQNMDWMNKHGFTVFVQVSAESAVSRLLSSKNRRPLLENKSREELMAYVKQHYTSRLPFYQQAQMTIKGENLSVDDLLVMIRLYEEVDKD